MEIEASSVLSNNRESRRCADNRGRLEECMDPWRAAGLIPLPLHRKKRLIVRRSFKDVVCAQWEETAGWRKRASKVKYDMNKDVNDNKRTHQVIMKAADRGDAFSAK